jgi:hypothetical protein
LLRVVVVQSVVALCVAVAVALLTAYVCVTAVLYTEKAKPAGPPLL